MLIFVALVVMVPAADAQPRVLVTGDSMATFLDVELRALLEPAGSGRVLAEIRNGTGLTKPFVFDWMRHATRQVARRRPDAIVASMGVNDGWPIDGSKCCRSRRWEAGYARLVERLDRRWRAAGVRHVYWLTIPEPVLSFLTTRIRAVNRALARTRGVALVDTRALLTPGGRFVARMETSPGVVEQVRSEDGVHLWHAGARIVATAVVARLREDGVVTIP